MKMFSNLVMRSSAALLCGASLFVLSGCDNKEKVLDIETPRGEVEVERDRDTGDTEVEINRTPAEDSVEVDTTPTE